MERIRNIFQHRCVWLLVVAIGLAARLAVATFGYNWDMRSWFAVAEITRHGGNVYAETMRYNYGPVWFYVVHGLDLLAAHHCQVLRYWIAAVISLADLGICLFLCRRAGRLVGVLFFLNPVSILISGYHGQFDNLAILLGLWSIQLFGDDFEQPLDRRKFCGLLVLGLSLLTKHVLFLFPLWLAVKQKGRWQKITVLCVPVMVFLLGFAPYWAAGGFGIMNNVFNYRGSYTRYFYNFFIPSGLQYFMDGDTIWLLLLIVFAFVCRNRNGFESLLIYTGVLVAFSPSTSNQYLAIPSALAAFFLNPLFVLYAAFSLLHLCADGRNGVLDHLQWLNPIQGRYDNYAIYCLCGALVWLLWRPQFSRLFQRIGNEIREQICRPQ